MVAADLSGNHIGQTITVTLPDKTQITGRLRSVAHTDKAVKIAIGERAGTYRFVAVKIGKIEEEVLADSPVEVNP